MPALNSLIWQQCHQIPISVSSVRHMLFACHGLTVALVTLPPPSMPHHVTMSPSPSIMMTTSCQQPNTQPPTTTTAHFYNNNKGPRHVKWHVLGHWYVFILVFIDFYFTNYDFLGAMSVRPPTTLRTWWTDSLRIMKYRSSTPCQP